MSVWYLQSWFTSRMDLIRPALRKGRRFFKFAGSGHIRPSGRAFGQSSKASLIAAQGNTQDKLTASSPILEINCWKHGEFFDDADPLSPLSLIEPSSVLSQACRLTTFAPRVRIATRVPQANQNVETEMEVEVDAEDSVPDDSDDAKVWITIGLTKVRLVFRVLGPCPDDSNARMHHSLTKVDLSLAVLNSQISTSRLTCTALL